MELVNATMDASQVACFIQEHRDSLREFNFENVMLRSGNWDDALAPLTRISGGEAWKLGQRDTETVDVPRVLTTKGTEEAKKSGQSGIPDTRAVVGEPGSYEAIAAVFGV
ncbi:hypothetical protein PITC_085310 [Penicillium italicum]|uniref:Uncharacterized protein n=1 Tax=Penicillium italicum TaxID=40296 RepID=A0A0A2L2F8_PENIT|nr:hypothetical protein PITC_085310 [Penicillium italicum]